MDEQELMETVTGVVGGPVPDPADLRGELVTNPEAPGWRSRDVDDLQGMVWHQELGWGSVEDVARYHTGPESHLREGGVRSIAYTLAVRRDGQVVLCNDLDRATWSQGTRDRPGDENRQFLAVMFEGMFQGPGVSDPSAGEPNAVQIRSGLAVWEACREVWGWSEGDLYGHTHFGKPACPGTTLGAVVEAVRAQEEPEPAADLDLTTVEGRQRALARLGYYEGAIDGIWGPRSRGALTRFQGDHGLATDGIWGPRSQAAVREALAEG